MSFHESPAELRARLRNPPNAVPDTGVKLKNGWPVSPNERTDAAIHELNKQLETLSKQLINIDKKYVSQLSGLSAQIEKIKLVLGESGLAEIQKGRPLRRILTTCCEYYEVSPSDMVGLGRRSGLIRPRHIALYLSRVCTSCSYQEIGRYFNRDHTTIISAFNKVSRLYEVDENIRDDVDNLKRICFPNGCVAFVPNKGNADVERDPVSPSQD